MQVSRCWIQPAGPCICPGNNLVTNTNTSETSAPYKEQLMIHTNFEWTYAYGC
ncbi:MAG: hypothetical protein IPL31_04425 [Saprospiraceae bacterium]|nr:hypothetical protein [Saprospiraceae bacterium]